MPGETLFYKKDGAPITPKEHEIIYKIMLETQFPMSVAYGNYYDDEIKTMNEKIQQQLPNSRIEATFIPTVLYELLFFQYKDDPLRERNAGLNTVFFVESRNGLETIKDSNFYQEFKKLHLILNNYIVKKIAPIPLNPILELFKEGEKPFPLVFDDALKAAVKNINQQRKVHNEDIERAIAIEYHAYNTGQFVIYRGSDFVDDFHDPKCPANRSMSFGSSLFSGCLRHKGSCPYAHMRDRKKYGYVVFIDKKQYVNGPLNNMFFIPPVTTLLSLLGGGDLFHVRTKFPRIGSQISGFCVDNIKLPQQVIPFFEIKGDSPEQRQEIYKQLLQYIQDHHLIFKERMPAKL
jgi:hypothetical protein